MKKRALDWYLFGFLAMGTPAAVVGCASGGGAMPEMEGFSSSASLEWDDLDAAVSYVAARQELALVEKSNVAVGETDGEAGVVRRYRLVDPRDRPVEIRFITDPGALDGLRSASALRSGTVVVRVGRFGDDQRERALASALIERLEALALID